MPQETTIAPQAFSPRSQASWKRELKLREEILSLRIKADGFGAELDKLKERQKDCEAALFGTEYASFNAERMLPTVIAEIMATERKETVFQERIALMEEEIKELREAPSEDAAKRLETQAEIACLARERLKKDELIDTTLQSLRSLLEDRSDISAKMRALAAEIDFEGSLDDDRHADLLVSLSGPLLPESRSWFENFTGTNAETNPFTVSSKVLIFPETLADAGVYFEGEVEELTGSAASQHAQEVTKR